MALRESAICLRAADFSETSQVVHFLTRGRGLVRLLAKGSKRSKSKSGGAIDLMSEGELVFIASSRDTLGTLTEFHETVWHGAIRRQADRLNAGLYLTELAGEMLAETDPHPEVFDLLHNALGRLGAEGAPVQAVVAYFQWRLLRHVGLLGGLAACCCCGSPLTGGGAGPPRNVYFSSRQGGLLCGACEGGAAEKFRVDGPGLAGLAALAAAEAGAKVVLPERQARSVNRILAYHITQQVARPLKMARYVLEEGGGPQAGGSRRQATAAPDSPGLGGAPAARAPGKTLNRPKVCGRRFRAQSPASKGAVEAGGPGP